LGAGESALLFKACGGILYKPEPGGCMKKYLVAASIVALCTSAVAQTDGLGPVNLPPDSFDGREFVDTAGCAFLRSTFGGEVTWIPRFGPDRNPVCGQEPTRFAQVAQDEGTSAAAAPDPEPAPQAPDSTTDTAEAPAPEAPRGRIEVLGGVAESGRPAPSYLGKEPPMAGLAPQRRTAPRPARLPQQDASGRHPSCPATSPYGQLVDTVQGRKMVRCVTSPSLFLDEYVTPVSTAPRAAVSGAGAHVQVGSFGVPANAHRLLARLTAQGLPVRQYQARGLSVVTIGPFSTAQAANSALAHVRGMGFRDAFLKR
jgi:cell division protein FtsN